MVNYKLVWRFSQSGLSSFGINDSETYVYSIYWKCGHCETPSKTPAIFTAQDNVELPGSRGSCNFLASCHFCKLPCHLSIHKVLMPTIEFEDEDIDTDLEYSVVLFDCRQFIPVRFEFSYDMLKATCPSGTEFESDDIEFEDGDWASMDIESETPVNIYDLTSAFIPITAKDLKKHKY